MGSLQAYKKRKGSRNNYSRHKFIQPTKKVVQIIETNKDEVVVKIKEEDEVIDKDKAMGKAQQISKRRNLNKRSWPRQLKIKG